MCVFTGVFFITNIRQNESEKKKNPITSVPCEEIKYPTAIRNIWSSQKASIGFMGLAITSFAASSISVIIAAYNELPAHIPDGFLRLRHPELDHFPESCEDDAFYPPLLRCKVDEDDYSLFSGKGGGLSWNTKTMAATALGVAGCAALLASGCFYLYFRKQDQLYSIKNVVKICHEINDLSNYDAFRCKFSAKKGRHSVPYLREIKAISEDLATEIRKANSHLANTEKQKLSRENFLKKVFATFSQTEFLNHGLSLLHVDEKEPLLETKDVDMSGLLAKIKSEALKRACKLEPLLTEP